MENGATGKSKVMGGLFAVFPPTGALGVHRFYLGNIGLGLVHVTLLGIGLILSITVIGALVGIPLLVVNGIWAIIEGIMIFGGAIKDSSGRPLV
ncbi:MAG: TM2 domain-containing protein [Thermoanaerobaculia bacterium]